MKRHVPARKVPNPIQVTSQPLEKAREALACLHIGERPRGAIVRLRYC
jgi:hypothetical protein